MCGIGAFIPRADIRNDEAIVANSICSLIIHNASRGTDSAGIAAVTTTGRTRIIKRALDPRTFLLQSDVQHAIQKWIAKNDVVAWIIHTRAATTGAVTDLNAHPFRCGHVTVVHNGWIYNHDTVASKKNLKLISQCDSEVIAAIMDHDPTYQKLAALCGEFAIIAYDSRISNSLYVARATNPLWYRPNTPWGTYFSSQPLASDAITARGKRVLADRNAWVSLGQESAGFFNMNKHHIVPTAPPKWESTYLRTTSWRSEHGYYGGIYTPSVYARHFARDHKSKSASTKDADTYDSMDDYWYAKGLQALERGELFDPVSVRLLTMSHTTDDVIGEAFDRGLVDSTSWTELTVQERARLYSWWSEMRRRYNVR